MTPQPEITPQSAKTPFIGGDKHIWGIYIALVIISVIELYSASSREVASSSMGVIGPIVRHFAQLAAGFVIVLVMQRIHYRRLIPAIPFFVLMSCLMMVVVLFFGESVNGASRSLNLVFINIQPSEFLKMSAVLSIAMLMSMVQDKNDRRAHNRLAYFTMGLVGVFAVLLIRDGLTNTLIVLIISVSMLLIGGTRFKQLAMGAVCVVAVGAVVFVGLQAFDSIKASANDEAAAAMEASPSKAGDSKEKGLLPRIGVWGDRLAAYSDTTNRYDRPITAENQQEMYSYMAQARGGVFGVFPGNSRETSRLPLAFSDFIYAIIIEDMGFVGGMAVLVLFLWLLARASGIAWKCRTAFPALLVIGMAVMIVTQALIHMAINTGVIPVTGQPLPLISKGGSSILITSLAFGIMLSVSRFAVRSDKRNDINAELNALPENMRSENPGQISNSVADE